MAGESPYPETTAEQRDPSTRVPPWISVFILFGALGALVILFSLACWFARSFLARTASHWPEPNFLDTRPEPDEVIARKMEQLDKLAPMKTLKERKAEIKDDPKQAAAQPTSVLVCAVCLDTMEDQEIIRALSCQHIYHSDCIVKWYLTRHDTCPLCKTFYVPHEEVTITVPRDSLRRGGLGARDDALLRYYQTVAV